MADAVAEWSDSVGERAAGRGDRAGQGDAAAGREAEAGAAADEAAAAVPAAPVGNGLRVGEVREDECEYDWEGECAGGWRRLDWGWAGCRRRLGW